MRGMKLVYFRRCHVCGCVNERESVRVERCGFCGKLLAAYFFFDEANIRVYTDNRKRPHSERTGSLYRTTDDEANWSLLGFSTIWK